MDKKLSKLFSQGMGIYWGFLALLCLLGWFFEPRPLVIVEILAALALVGYYIYRGIHRRDQLRQYFEDASFSVGAVSEDRMSLPLPAMIVNLDQEEITWSNESFRVLVDFQESLFETPIRDVLPEMSVQWLRDGRTQCPEPVVIGDRRYRVYGSIIRTKDEDRDAGKAKKPPSSAMLYFADLTELLDIQDDFENSRPVVSLIMLDNYDELTANLSDRSISGITARLDDAITSWATGGILRKLERNRYLFLFEQRYLPRFIEEKFSILDTVHAITNDFGIPATLTIGVGRDGQTLQENYDFANLGLEMSLSRGGDQAVVKDRYNFSFYGGRSQETERRTRVKSRVMAGSLQELIDQSSRVYIMGHKNADLDAVGAAVGVMAICRKLGADARIIIDLDVNASKAMLAKLLPLPAYNGKFISGETALKEFRDDALLVVVDTNRPDQVESRPFLERCRRVAVIDHHRRAADYIEGALLNFHEPYASSASELVTELIGYLMDGRDLLPEEIMALLAGIVLDTKHFSVRTGARTFEAAAWLRNHGADTVAVKLLFQNDLQSTLSRYEILKHAELYKDDIALCALDRKCDRIIAAQAADELLNITGIQASFVFYPDGDRVICSGRSIGEANVQMILEPLGGGGNQATAGAQIKGMTVAQVKTALKLSIDEFFKPPEPGIPFQLKKSEIPPELTARSDAMQMELPD